MRQLMIAVTPLLAMFGIFELTTKDAAAEAAIFKCSRGYYIAYVGPNIDAMWERLLYDHPTMSAKDCIVAGSRKGGWCTIARDPTYDAYSAVIAAPTQEDAIRTAAEDCVSGGGRPDTCQPFGITEDKGITRAQQCGGGGY